VSVALLARAECRIPVIQGEYRISGRPDVVLTTLLGSCVSFCLHDPVARVGGMNHFLLPGTEQEDEDAGRSLRYGAYAMELLMNGLLAHGAKRSRLEAKLFGGARIVAGLADLGARNAAFAQEYVRRENIALAAVSLRGQRGRRIQFWPHSGRTRQLWLAHNAGEPVPGLTECAGAGPPS
jgi:chemotaxis protein CheD